MFHVKPHPSVLSGEALTKSKSEERTLRRHAVAPGEPVRARLVLAKDPVLELVVDALDGPQAELAERPRRPPPHPLFLVRAGRL
jgi:hypothetical protein